MSLSNLVSLKISLLTRPEWEAVANLAAGISAQLISPAFFNWNFQTVLDELEKSDTLIVKKVELILAFLSFRTYPDRIEIMALATASSAARQGFGSNLIQALQLIAAQRRLPISLEVHENNQQAVNFYLKNGFSVIGSRKSYYSDGGDAVIMQSFSNANIQS